MLFALLCFISVQDKDCTETFRNSSGWIASPDQDANGFYDFNLKCFWTVVVDPSKHIRFQLSYIDIVTSPDCTLDYIAVSLSGAYDLTVNFL